MFHRRGVACLPALVVWNVLRRHTIPKPELTSMASGQDRIQSCRDGAMFLLKLAIVHAVRHILSSRPRRPGFEF